MEQSIINTSSFLISKYVASCSNGQIRLIEGTSEIEGRAEICSNQRWETISTRFWSSEEARVTCNALGYGFGKKCRL